MPRTLDMQFIRYMNLFGKISGIRAKHCFSYNNMLIFVVPAGFVKRAIGPDYINLQKLGRILSKRIRVVSQPKSRTQGELQTFVSTIVAPVKFNTLEMTDSAVTITAGMEGKARLIGKQHIRQKELQDILKQYFGIERLNIA